MVHVIELYVIVYNMYIYYIFYIIEDHIYKLTYTYRKVHIYYYIYRDYTYYIVHIYYYIYRDLLYQVHSIEM